MSQSRIAYVLPFIKSHVAQAQELPGKPKSLVIAISKDQARRIRDRIQITYDYPEIMEFNFDNWVGKREVEAEWNPKAWICIGQSYIAFSDEDERRHFSYSSFDKLRQLELGGPSIEVMIHQVGVGFSVGGCNTEMIDVVELNNVFGLDR